MEIDQKPPKKIRYSIALYNKVGRKGFWNSVQKFGKKLMRKNPDYYTKSELKDFLHHKNSSSANDFLQELEKDQILLQKGKRDKNGKPVKTYDIDREKLLKETINQPYFDFYLGRKKHKFDKDVITDIFMKRD